MVTRHTCCVRNIIEGDILREVILDEPQRLSRRIRTSSHGTRLTACRYPYLIAVAVFFLISSTAIFFATSRAWSAGTLTSGSTPVPSQFVLERGLMARANGTPMLK